eukprot:scaffold81127_cov67-Cyclotella_meneghiniana.AAC.4
MLTLGYRSNERKGKRRKGNTLHFRAVYYKLALRFAPASPLGLMFYFRGRVLTSDRQPRLAGHHAGHYRTPHIHQKISTT